MTNKMTYVQALDNAIAITAGETHERLIALRESLIRRNSHRSDKPTKAQVANETLKGEIFTFVRENAPVRAGEVANYFGISGQKATALLGQLVKADELVKFSEKQVTYFKVANVVEAEYLDGEITV